MKQKILAPITADDIINIQRLREAYDNVLQSDLDAIRPVLGSGATYYQFWLEVRLARLLESFSDVAPLPRFYALPTSETSTT